MKYERNGTHMKNVYLIRHGQTLFNAQSKIQGFCDSPLTSLGIKQAEVARDHIDELGIKFDDAYSSTSERAIDTLSIITDIESQSIKDLREWNFGRLEGEGEHLNPSLPYGDFFVQYDGEGEQEFNDRISNIILKLTKESDGKDIVMVSHGAAIAQFYITWEHNNEVNRKARIQNCSIFRYEFENDEFTLKEIIEHDIV